MLVELNGLSFHLHISDATTAPRFACIVDEGFHYDQMNVDIQGPDCVLALIERYSGLRPDQAVSDQVRRHMTPSRWAA